MEKYKAGPYLSQIEIPSDLRDKFNIDDLPTLGLPIIFTKLDLCIHLQT